MRFFSSIVLAALAGSVCSIGVANANTIDFAISPLSGTAGYTGASLDQSTAFDLGAGAAGTLSVHPVGVGDQSGLTDGDTTSVTISPTNIQFGSGTGNVSNALTTSITKAWSDSLGNFSETFTTVDFIGRGTANTVAVLLEGLLNGPGFTNSTVFFLLTANQSLPPNGAISWSASESSTNPINNPAPLPAALPLLATGLGAFGLLGWRRKRKAAALAA